MSGMDGLGVLKVMNKEHLIEDIPVIMISSEDSELHIRQAYEMGVSDYIGRPFDTSVVRQRVYNTIKLYAKQRRLMNLVTESIQDKENNNQMMIGILSHIVEFRNGESGQHVLHINQITQMLLETLTKKTGRYNLTWHDRFIIATASALHDIGKIGIPEEIINKPARLTTEEFENGADGASLTYKNDAGEEKTVPVIKSPFVFSFNKDATDEDGISAPITAYSEKADTLDAVFSAYADGIAK